MSVSTKFVLRILFLCVDLFSLVADPSGHVSPKRLGLLLHDQLQVRVHLSDIELEYIH